MLRSRSWLSGSGLPRGRVLRQIGGCSSGSIRWRLIGPRASVMWGSEMCFHSL
jgi:hypothetical protein